MRLQCRDVADIVATNRMNENANLEEDAQCADANQLAAADDCLRFEGLRLHSPRYQRIKAVIAIGNDADFHAVEFVSQIFVALGIIRSQIGYNYIVRVIP